MRIEVTGLEGLPEVEHGDDLAALLCQAAERNGTALCDGDVVVVAQKVVSKSEGRLISLGEVSPSPRATAIAERLQGDPRMVQVVLDMSVRVVREERVLIVETQQGFICANAGVDRSNVAGERATLLPEDCDRSADRLRDAIRDRSGAGVGVVISDSFGRPWRMGLTDIALGVAGMPALVDHRGTEDDFGSPLRATVVALADEVAGAAELVMGKTNRTPAAVVRGLQLVTAAGSGQDLLRPAAEDLFR